MTSEQNLAFQEMLEGIGKGIGNTVAHEIGHQFMLDSMDCNRPANFEYQGQPAGPPCSGPAPENFKNLYEYYKSAKYSDVGPPLQWTPEDATKLWNMFLKKREAQ